MSYHTFTEKSTCFIHNQSDAIITRPNLVYLPKYPVHSYAGNQYIQSYGRFNYNQQQF